MLYTTELPNFTSRKKYTGTNKRETLAREHLDNSAIRRDLRIYVEISNCTNFSFLTL